uniref:Tyrosine-protein kinase receptor n=1 Tax=Panagrellus redivivus TaxID=6233 RepID=A0A7E4VUV3_PANRE
MKFVKLYLLIAIFLIEVSFAKNKAVVCDFEKDRPCDWYFTNSEEIKAAEQQKARKLHVNATISNLPGVSEYGSKPNSDGNFKIVTGMMSPAKSSAYAYYSSNRHSKKVAMIISPYYQHASASCALTFNYRIIGEKGAHLLVSTQLIPFHVISSEEISDEEAADWITPTQRQTIPASDSMADSQQVIVQIGEILQPTRIRIECHAKGAGGGHSGNGMGGDLNVECMVDDIRFENCNENIWRPNLCSMDTHPKRYLCHQYKDQKCVDYADICDMHQDCPGREDEDPQLHNCKLAPSSARCTFEETRYEAGCENWVIVNMPNSVELIKLASVAAPANSPQSLQSSLTKMPLDKTNNQPNSGHYLMFSTFGHDHAVNNKFSPDSSSRSGHSGGGILYSHAMTPIYPRMDPRLGEPSSKLFGTCMMRFFFCHVGSTNFQIILERIKSHHKQVIWTPPRASLVEPCVWEKAAVALDYQNSEYFLKFGIAKMNNHKAMFLMDDFSMTPNCFLMKDSLLESTLPPSITLTSCGLSGAIPPDSKRCETLGAQNRRIDGEVAISGRRSFMVDKKVEYRIELYGAAGGLLPGRAKSENFGSMVILNHVFDMADEVTFVVGQTGETPCQTRTTSKKFQEITEILCSPTTRTKSRLRDFPMDVPGTAGGGASAIFVNGQALAIAGGGAGIYPEELIDADLHQSTKNDHFFDYIPASRSLRSIRAAQNSDSDTSFWAAGPGGAYNSSNHQYSQDDNCPDCAIMRGQLLSASNAKPGGCPAGRPWTLLGGFGGGGASCGPGGGGGAGFNGGAPGQKTPGEPGTSAVFAPVQKFISKTGINDANGKIVLRECTLTCVINATCRFEDPVDGQIPREYCECSNGVRVTGSDSCASGIQSVVGRVKNTIDATHPRTLLTLILLLLLMMLCPCLLFILFRIYSTRRKTKAFKNFHNELQLIATDPLGMGNGAGAIVTRGSISSNGRMNLITGNPLYQYTGLQQVPYVSREWCEFHDVIGHGAFGEVQSGTMTSPGGKPFRVAIKTLPVESNPEVISDFQTEARILSNFNHPNIVRFYGVCFDSVPKFIVLELLEGGDLKNYLRECRPKGLQSNGSSSIPTSPATHTPPSTSFTLMMSDLVQMALDVAKGCEYLECNKFVHRDIAARNCLLTSKNPLMRVVKIADFGMARDIYSNDYYRKGGRAFLPVKWMPPEAFLDGIFTSKTDTWAFGILLWELFSIGFTPYTGRQNQEVMQLIVSGGRLDPPIGTPDEVYKFMICCWETSAELRPNFTQIVAFLNAALKLNSVVDAPLPPIVHKMVHKKSSTPPSIRSSAPPGDNDLGTTSQATISTMVTSMTESTTTSSYDSMPTKGEGVTHNLCAPYETKLARPVISMNPPLERVASGDESMSSHDESTLHDTCSVKQSPYAIGTIGGQPGESSSSLQKDHPSGASLRSQGTAPPGSGSAASLPFHKRLFRKSFERPKTGPNQPLISSTTSSSSSTTGGGRGESASPAAAAASQQSSSVKRNDNQSPPLPSQLL